MGQRFFLSLLFFNNKLKIPYPLNELPFFLTYNWHTLVSGIQHNDSLLYILMKYTVYIVK